MLVYRSVHLWMATFQLDDEPNLHRGHGWKSQFPSILNWIGVPGMWSSWKIHHFLHSLKLTAILHLEMGRDPKGNEKVFQPSIFRFYVSFREGNRRYIDSNGWFFRVIVVFRVFSHSSWWFWATHLKNIKISQIGSSPQVSKENVVYRWVTAWGYFYLPWNFQFGWKMVLLQGPGAPPCGELPHNIAIPKTQQKETT